VQNTTLQLSDSLPLTCSRSGTCCHGNLVRLNPWELAQLADAKNMSTEQFAKEYTLAEGAIINFDGKPNHTGKQSCRLYKEGEGCSVHPARPLACRLFPLGRQIQHETAFYIFEGSQFPCLRECPEVVDLPHLTIETYLAGQQTSAFELAQDEYLEVMQNIADIALALLLDTGLNESGDTKTIRAWRNLGTFGPESLAQRIDPDWLNLLMIPNIESSSNHPETFVREHNELLQIRAQQAFESLANFKEVRKSAELTMAMALFLAHALGADAKGLSEHWIEIAKNNGASE